MPASRASDEGAVKLGRYTLHDEIAAGGMATVHLGKLNGPAGVSRVVAIKRMHPHLAKDPAFSTMFLDEARLAARIRHNNLVGLLELVHERGELFLVMDYVTGETLARLTRREESLERMPPSMAVALAVAVLHGLHAAHTATDDQGRALGVVHRDVSPQNILVGEDGAPRLLDFGVAKAAGRRQTTREGQVKGKLSYMAPEQFADAKSVDGRADVYAVSVVLWELLTGERLFDGAGDGVILAKVLSGVVDPPSRLAPDLPACLDDIVMRGLEKDPDDRFASAGEMADALEAAVRTATVREIGAWVSTAAQEALAERARIVAAIERGGSGAPEPTPDESAASDLGGALLAQPEPTRLLTASGAAAPRANWRRARGAIAGLAGIAVAATALASTRWGVGTPEEPARHPASAPVSAAQTAAPVAQTAAPAAQTAPTPIASAAPAVSASETARPGPAPKKPPSRPAAAPRPPMTKASSTIPTRGAECLYKDAAGITRVRAECLH